MSSQRSERAWIPAAVASIAWVIGLLGLWAVNKAVGDNRAGPGDVDAPLWTWLLATNNQLFGSDPFSGGGRAALATLVGVVAVLVIAYAGTWWALRGLRPGSALLPAFLSTWLVLVLAAVVGAGLRWVVAAQDLSFPGAGRVQYSVLSGGAVTGVRLGWVAALLVVLVWAAVRPGADASPEPVWDDDLAEEDESSREFVMKRRTDFNLEDAATARRNAETFGRREGDRPEPAYEPSPAPHDGSQDGSQNGPQPETYVGRRSSGRYAEDDDETAPSVPDTSGGSHRG